MKLHTLVLAVLLCATAPVPAQTQTVQQPRKPEVAANTTPRMNGRVTLLPGTLREVVGEIENLIPIWMEVSGRKDWEMPNVVYDAEVAEIALPAPLSLHHVDPLQAIALAAAAAGCSIQPITLTQERGVPQPAIGYRIVRATNPWNPAPQFQGAVAAYPDAIGGIGITPVKDGAGVLVLSVLPDSPAGRSSVIQAGQHLLSLAEEGKPAVSVEGLELEKVTELIRGKPGSTVKLTLGADSGNGLLKRQEVSLVRENLESLYPLPLREPVQVRVMTPSPFDPRPASMAPGRADPNHRFVRVYALGAILGGDDQESVRKSEQLQRLISFTLEEANARSNLPLLAVHKESAVLVATATATQHELIEQVIKAFRENTAQSADSVKPSLER